MDGYNNIPDTFLTDLPSSQEAEQSILGACLLDAQALSKVMENLKPAHFYDKKHTDLFNIMVELFVDGAPIDRLLLTEYARQNRVFDSAEDARQYLATLASIVPSINNVEYYTEIVKEKFYLRQLIIESQDIITTARNEQNSAADMLDFAESKIYNIRQDNVQSGLVHIKDVLTDTYVILQNKCSPDKSEHLATSTGFSALDTYITGLKKSNLLILAARPGMGKTAFALNIATNVGLASSNKSVAIFSLEMGSEQLAQRLLSSVAKVDSNKFETGQLGEDDWTNVSDATARLAKSNIYINDNPGLKVAEMTASLRRVNNLGLVVIDYLQLLETGGSGQNRVQEISQITRGLKIMSRTLDVPVIALSQLSRSIESRADRTPMLSDLRESGSIEQDADIVMFLYREGYYDTDLEDQSGAKCIIAKNRHGSIGSIDLYWDGKYTRFSGVQYRNEGV